MGYRDGAASAACTPCSGDQKQGTPIISCASYLKDRAVRGTAPRPDGRTRTSDSCSQGRRFPSSLHPDSRRCAVTPKGPAGNHRAHKIPSCAGCASHSAYFGATGTTPMHRGPLLRGWLPSSQPSPCRFTSGALPFKLSGPLTRPRGALESPSPLSSGTPGSNRVYPTPEAGGLPSSSSQVKLTSRTGAPRARSG